MKKNIIFYSITFIILLVFTISHFRYSKDSYDKVLLALKENKIDLALKYSKNLDKNSINHLNLLLELYRKTDDSKKVLDVYNELISKSTEKIDKSSFSFQKAIYLTKLGAFDEAMAILKNEDIEKNISYYILYAFLDSNNSDIYIEKLVETFNAPFNYKYNILFEIFNDIKIFNNVENLVINSLKLNEDDKNKFLSLFYTSMNEKDKAKVYINNGLKIKDSKYNKFFNDLSNLLKKSDTKKKE